jgi:hypothetical protein
MKRGLQTGETESELSRMLGDLDAQNAVGDTIRFRPKVDLNNRARGGAPGKQLHYHLSVDK